MADFDKAVAGVILEEGGYVNDPQDPGGETNYGISKRTYPHLDIARLTLKEAEEIYRRDYWERIRGEELHSQPIANKLLSLAVNMGVQTASKIFQQAICDSGLLVTCDGVVGNLTVNSANNVFPFDLLTALKARAVNHYRVLALENPKLVKYLHGWIDRAMA